MLFVLGAPYQEPGTKTKYIFVLYQIFHLKIFNLITPTKSLLPYIIIIPKYLSAGWLKVV